ncbi:MAG: IMP cyclohydrolase [Firmicutes bacterium]|nr:IMP cyclohydrolase [Bacillota bacterium]
MNELQTYLAQNPYPGRGVLLGVTPDGRGIAAYFIMGRSVNSRNRIFVLEEKGMRTQAHRPELLSDPSLIIYWPVRQVDGGLAVTNGDQTDDIAEALAQGHCFAHALHRRVYEPDAPNYTPRISGLIRRGEQGFSYRLSIIKRGLADADVRHYFYEYQHPQPGFGHLIHTYAGDGSPLPSFTGEPPVFALPEDGESLGQQIWQSLNPDNKVSLWTAEWRPGEGWRQNVWNKNLGQ